jgi:hypothetical protein
MISRWESRKVRGQDLKGSGAFAASRSGKRHKGEDYEFAPNEPVLSPVEGLVTRVGWCYQGEDYRLVELLTHKGYLLWRFLYIDPKVKAGDKVTLDQTLGTAQNIAAKYGGESKMTNHVHVEINLKPSGVIGGQHGA